MVLPQPLLQLPQALALRKRHAARRLPLRSAARGCCRDELRVSRLPRRLLLLLRPASRPVPSPSSACCCWSATGRGCAAVACAVGAYELQPRFFPTLLPRHSLFSP
jgi:hypothetical protein